MAKAAANTETGAPVAEQPAELINYQDTVGTLTYERAVDVFGKGKALAAMKKFAELGGHGVFDDEELMSPLFGGLAWPKAHDEMAAAQKDRANADAAKINAALNDLK